ncbi:MAG: hypothetical protein LBO66_00760, partial [Deltaproteobacteria bacterium]|nr:hypothetical protein [Deltaproteobacteria bacterium]
MPNFNMEDLVLHQPVDRFLKALMASEKYRPAILRLLQVPPELSEGSRLLNREIFLTNMGRRFLDCPVELRNKLVIDYEFVTTWRESHFDKLFEYLPPLVKTLSKEKKERARVIMELVVLRGTAKKKRQDFYLSDNLLGELCVYFKPPIFFMKDHIDM